MFNLYVLGFTHWAVKFDKNKGDWGRKVEQRVVYELYEFCSQIVDFLF